jgi:succinyl-CoA synthetase alpha subunit
MSILVDEQDAGALPGHHRSGRQSFHCGQMLEYGTELVAGVTPGKGGTRFNEEVPVFDTVQEAVRETGAKASVIFVPPPFAADAILEAADAGVCADHRHHRGHSGAGHGALKQALARHREVRLVGPNCPGVITPGPSAR